VIARTRDGYHHARPPAAGLTELERRVLHAYAHGMNRRQIGAHFGLSERTVGHYLTVAKEKLGAETLVHAAVLSLAETGS
jgi:DNA-binding NarL/FixJ family response regulator